VLESKSKNKNIRDLYSSINEFKKDYQPRINLVTAERGHLLVNPHNILNRWKNYFCQLLNVHGACGVREAKMHTTEPFVPQPCASEVEATTGKLKRYISPCSDQIPAELIHARKEPLHSGIHKLMKLIWKESVVVPIYKKGDKTECTNY
jgi:hypothetical protein